MPADTLLAFLDESDLDEPPAHAPRAAAWNTTLAARDQVLDGVVTYGYQGAALTLYGWDEQVLSVRSGHHASKARGYTRHADGAPWCVALPIKDALVVLTNICQGPVTPRLAALAKVAGLARTCNSGYLPLLSTGQVSWEPVLSHSASQALVAAVWQAAELGGAEHYWGGGMEVELLYFFCRELVTSTVSPPVWRPAKFQSPAGMKAWHERVLARAASGRRLALRLVPPAGEGAFTLNALLVPLGAEQGDTTDTPDTTGATSGGVEQDEWPLADLLSGEADESVYDIGTEQAEELLDLEWQALNRTAKALARHCDLRDALTGWELDDEAVVDFLSEDLARLNAAGIELRAPGSLLRSVAAHTKVKVVGNATTLGADTLRLQVSVDVDGQQLDAATLAALEKRSATLLKINGEWVRLDHSSRKRAVQLVARARRGVSALDLTDQELVSDEFDASAVPGWIGDLLRGQWSLGAVKRLTIPRLLAAELRGYQKRGADWLGWLEQHSLGGILADDMGTGKTVQALSAIARDHTGPTLVVCPTSVIHNWQRESARFTPKLKVCVYHGPDRALGNCDIVITSYGLLRSDADLAKLSWHRVIFDEAQALKNHLSKAFKAAMRVQATHRLVMTGTPVENHIGDLWSLMQLVNPGLLGSYARFMARYRVKYNRAELAQQSPDEHSDRATAGLSEAGLSEAGLSEAGLCETDLLVESYARLRQLIAPFVLRREKTDPGVADDLPEKFTTKEECRLTKEQIGLYNATVSTMLESAEQAGSEFARRGAILTGIMRLKQICTHPSMATATAGAIAGRSGKVERIEGLLAEIVDEGSAALIFTQWTAWMGPLAAHLSKVLGREVLTLEGKMTTKARQKVIDRFNASDGPPVLIVSLKAGGSGLNLVRATHVLHADRWWNPAVEQQATDRAHRIGQTRSVQVHTMICPGTVEDRIDQLLEEKRATASAVVRSGETQITELSTAELHDFVALITEEVLR